MIRLFLALLLLAGCPLQTRAATGLSSIIFTNANKRSFIVDLSAAPTNMVKVNLNGPGQPDGPGDIWTFIATNSISGDWTNTGTLLIPKDSQYNWAFEQNVLYNPTGHGQIGTTDEYLGSTFQENVIWTRFGTLDARTFDSFGPTDPSGVIDAAKGSVWRNTLDGTVWSKTSDTGTAGWVKLGGTSLWQLSQFSGLTNLIPVLNDWQPMTENGWFVGTNSAAYWGGPLTDASFVSFRDTTHGETGVWEIHAGGGDPLGTRAIFSAAGLANSARIRLSFSGVDKFIANPSAIDGDPILLANSTITHTTGNLAEFANNGTNIAWVTAADGSGFGPDLALKDPLGATAYFGNHQPFARASGANGVQLEDLRGTFLQFSDHTFTPLQTFTDFGWDGIQSPEFAIHDVNLVGALHAYGYIGSSGAGSDLSRISLSGGATNTYNYINSESAGDAGVPNGIMFQIGSTNKMLLSREGVLQIGLLEPDLSSFDGNATALSIVGETGPGSIPQINIMGFNGENPYGPEITVYTSQGTKASPTNIVDGGYLTTLNLLGRVADDWEYEADLFWLYHDDYVSVDFGARTGIQFNFSSFERASADAGLFPLAKGSLELNDGIPLSYGGNLAAITVSQVRFGTNILSNSGTNLTWNGGTVTVVYPP